MVARLIDCTDMSLPTAVTPVALTELCQAFLQYVRTVRFSSQVSAQGVILTKTQLVFTMVLSDLMAILADENVHADIIAELSKIIDSARALSNCESRTGHSACCFLTTSCTSCAALKTYHPPALSL